MKRAPPPPRGFTWDPNKNQINVDQHGVPFELAPYVFHAKTPKTIYETKTSKRDQGPRRVAIARLNGKNLKTVYVQDAGNRRIVSMHRANAKDVALLKQNQKSLKESHDPRTVQEIRQWQTLGRQQQAQVLPLTREQKKIADRERSDIDKRAHQEKWSKDKRDRAYSDLRSRHRSRTEPIRAKYQPKQEAERAAMARSIQKQRKMSAVAQTKKTSPGRQQGQTGPKRGR